MTEQVKKILSWYSSDNPGTLTNLSRILNHGKLAGTGKMVILPVDQGFEHGPIRTFAKNPAGFNPDYHFELAIESGCNAYAAPLGFLEAGAAKYAGEVPLILKINNSDVMYQPGGDPISALTSYVDDALRLGCVGIGFTIYPGSSQRKLGSGVIVSITIGYGAITSVLNSMCSAVEPEFATLIRCFIIFFSGSWFSGRG